MPTFVDPEWVRWHDTLNGDQLSAAARITGDPTGSIATAERANAWSSVAPSAPAGVMSSFARAGIQPDSELGKWLVTAGLPQLGLTSSMVGSTGKTTAQGASALLGNPEALAGIAKLPLDVQTALLKGHSAADIGAYLDNPDAMARILQGKSPTHHVSFWEHVGSAISPVSQPVFAALQSGYEGIQAGYREAVANPEVSDPTGTNLQRTSAAIAGKAQTPMERYGTEFKTLGGGTIKVGTTGDVLDLPDQLTLAHMLRGEDAGKGIFPAGKAHEEAVRAQQRAASINGHALTPGRAAAALVTQPGTVPYQLLSGATDALVAWEGDPAATVMKELTAAHKGARIFTATHDDALAAVADHLVSTAAPAQLADVRAWTGTSAVAAQIRIKDAIVAQLRAHPGSLQELVDQGITSHADVLHAMGMSANGTINGLRAMVHPPTALEWLNNGTGQKFVNRIARTADFDDIWQATKGKLPAAVVADLADTTDPAKVASLLGEHIGADLQQVPGRTATYNWTRPFDTNRFTAYLPKGSVDVSDVNNAVDQARRTLATTHLVPRDQWSDILKPIARAKTQADMYQAYVHGIGDPLADAIAAKRPDLDPGAVKKMVRFFNEGWETDRRYAIDEMGKTPHVPGTLVNGQQVPMDGPFLWNQLLHRSIPALNVNEINRNVGLWGKLWNTPVLGPTFKGADFLMQGVTGAFKIGTLAKLALPVRFLADEQARMAAAGFDSTFAHPLTYIAWAAGGREGVDEKFLQELSEHPISTFLSHPVKSFTQHSQLALGTAGVKIAGLSNAHGVIGALDVMGERFIDQAGEQSSAFARGMGGMQSGSRSPYTSDQLFSKHLDVFGRDHDGYLKAIESEIARLHMDPVAKQVARAMLDNTYVPHGLPQYATGLPANATDTIDYGKYFHGDSLNQAGRDLVGNDPDKIEALHNIYDTVIEHHLRGAIRRSDEADEGAAAVLRNLENETSGGLGAADHEAIRDQAIAELKRKLFEHGAPIEQPPAVAGTDAVKLWFHEGFGSRYAQDLAEANVWRGTSPDLVKNRAFSDGYIDKIAEQIRTKTGNDNDLIRAIAQGDPFKVKATMPELRQALRAAKGDEQAVDAIKERMNVAVKFDKKLEEMRFPRNDPFGNPLATLPDEAIGPVRDQTAVVHGTLGKLGTAADHGADRMLGALMDVPSMTLTRSPLFRQAYWGRLDEMLPHMDAATIDQVKTAAAAANVQLPHGAITNGSGLVDSLAQADKIAKAHGVGVVRDLLYYPGERSGAMNIMRNVLPFGEAWKNVLTKWAKITYENPVVVRRVQQGVVDSRESGWWYKDPADGIEKFTLVPGQIMEKLSGVPFPLVSPVKGLNIVGQGIPAVGPAIVWPAAALMSQIHGIPGEKKLHDMLLPYGDPEMAQGGGLLEELFPGWLDKLRAGGWLLKAATGIGPTQHQSMVMNNVIKQVMTYKMSSGGFDLSKEEDRARLEHESTHDAQMLYLWRGLAQAASPSAPQALPVAKLKDGGMIEQWLLARDYNAMMSQNQGDSYAATLQFIDKYGQNLVFASQPFSRPTVYGVPTTEQAEAWRADHSQFVKDHNAVWGYFTPQTGKYTYQAYLEQIKNGTREALSPDEWMRLAEARVGNAAFDQARRRFGASPSDEQRAWLDRYKARLTDQFPGFNDDGIKNESASFDQKIHQLQSAVTHEDVKGMPLAHAATVYLHYRDQMLDAARSRGYSTLNGKAVADLREWLYRRGTQIATEIPEFTAMWNGLLQDEVNTDG